MRRSFHSHFDLRLQHDKKSDEEEEEEEAKPFCMKPQTMALKGFQ
jgi:hypothetical protein